MTIDGRSVEGGSAKPVYVVNGTPGEGGGVEVVAQTRAFSGVASIAVAPAAYAAQDAVGTVFSIPNAFDAGGLLTITDLVVATRGSLPLKVVLFTQNPGAIATDNVLFAWPGMANIAEVAPLTTPVVQGTIYHSRITEPLAVVNAGATTTLYGLLIATDAGTLTDTPVEVRVTGYRN